MNSKAKAARDAVKAKRREQRQKQQELSRHERKAVETLRKEGCQLIDDITHEATRISKLVDTADWAKAEILAQNRWMSRKRAVLHLGMKHTHEIHFKIGMKEYILTRICIDERGTLCVLRDSLFGTRRIVPIQAFRHIRGFCGWIDEFQKILEELRSISEIPTKYRK